MLSLPDFKEKGLIVCFATEGQRISFRNDNLLIQDKDGNTVMQNTCHRIFGLWVVGSTTLTSGILEKSKKFGFPVVLMSQTHRVIGLWSSPTEGNFLLRKKQYEYNDLGIAGVLIWNKINNQSALLRSVRKKDMALKDGIQRLDDYADSALKATNLHELLGLEGSASRVYFGLWFCDFQWKGRKPRAKIDALNATMDIGYTYLFNFMEALLSLYGFDLYQGVYHRCFYQRKSLVCDLVEPFRPIIDAQIKKALNLRQLLPEHDFNVVKGKYLLKPEKNKDYTRWILQALLERKEDMFGYVQGYYRSFMRNKHPEEYPVFQL